MSDADPANGAGAIDVGSRRQLFIDDRFIAEARDVALTMNPPTQHDEPLLVGDRPWEPLGVRNYTTVMLDRGGSWTGAPFRMWYAAVLRDGPPAEGNIRVGYAESEDGLTWHKPSLGLIEFEGSKDNNIVAPLLERQSQQGATVVRDDAAPPEERYKLWTKFQPTNDEIARGARPGLYAMHSPDGLRWRPYPNQPNPPDQQCDTQNMLFWDRGIDRWVGYTRVRETQRADEAAAAGHHRYRSVGRITSPDLTRWSSTHIVLEADRADLSIPTPVPPAEPEGPLPRPTLDFYTSNAAPYAWAADVYLMMPAVYYHWRGDYPATMDVQLLTSRDGISWRRAGERKPFLRRGLDGSATSGWICANPWLIPMGDELWLYYTGTSRRHGDANAKSDRNGVFRATLRRDGFVSADAGFHGGELTTPPLRFAGERLELNCDCGGGGWLQVEIQDAAGRPLEGYAATDCDPVVANAIAATVTWRGQASVAALAGRPVRLRCSMRDTKLYAFQFVSAAAAGAPGAPPEPWAGGRVSP
jgi:hypothetical protein